MIKVPFTKYTSCGNNFIILDELDGPVVAEDLLGPIAPSAIDGCFGVGADNFLVVQRASPQILEAIRASKNYWSSAPELGDASYLFRMFEPDGSEALSCGNGLLSLAQHLREHRGIGATTITTRLPMHEPLVLDLGVSESSGRAWVNLGRPVRMPETLLASSARRTVSGSVDVLHDLEVRFRRYDLAPFFDQNTLTFEAYVTFTGEPHLVLFPEGILAELMFGPKDATGASVAPEKRRHFGTWLLGRIGDFLNTQARELFPQGVTVNVARVRDANAIEYRSYERGVWRETLACGTGALAVATASRAMGMVAAQNLLLYPHRCTWQDRDAVLRVRPGGDGGWMLEGQPRAICEGVLNADVSFANCSDDGPDAVSGPMGFETPASAPAGL